MLFFTQQVTFLIIKHKICSCTFAQITLNINYYYSDPPSIQQAFASAAKSWIGQTVTLQCVSDGIPTPTLTWYKPDGVSQVNSVTATQNTVNVKMEVDKDFGGYKCDADNGLTAADYKIVKVQQISECSLSLCH